MNCLRSLRHNFRQFLGLSSNQRSLLLRGLLYLPLAWLLLRTVGFSRLASFLLRPVADGRASRVAPDWKKVSASARMVHLAERYGIVPRNCLRRSLVLCYLLQRQGVASNLQIGVDCGGGNFQAHSWVEVDGLVVNDGQDVHERYTAFSGLAENLASRGG
jgi:hypothetical protein